jgi:alpha-beta hydrolase superfamily lysophospholipase
MTTMNRLMRKIIFSLLVLFLICSAGCTSLFFYPEKQLLDNPAAQKFSPEDIWFKASDGVNLHGWFFNGGPKATGTVLVLHGNAENLSTHVNSVLWLVKEGFNLFIFDYRGYGKSEGSPGINGVHLDAEAALKTLLTMPRAGGKQIIVLGQSIGGAASIRRISYKNGSPHW